MISNITDGVVIFFSDQRTLLMQKTNKELKAMLKGVKCLSRLKKSQLVDLVLKSDFRFLGDQC